MKPKKIKAWAVICPKDGFTWAFESVDAAEEAKRNHDGAGHGKHKVVPCVIILTLQPNKKRKKK